jgi:outer membrane biosynthesis protein TonB
MSDTTQVPAVISRAKALLLLKKKLDQDDSAPVAKRLAVYSMIAKIPDEVMQAATATRPTAPPQPAASTWQKAAAATPPTVRPKPTPAAPPTVTIKADSPLGQRVTIEPESPVPPTAPPQPAASTWQKATPKAAAATPPTAPPKPTTAAPATPPQPTAPPKPTTAAPTKMTAPGVPRGTWRARKVKDGLAIRSDDLGALRSDDSSGFEEVYQAVSGYESAPPDEKFSQLQALDGKATDWVNSPAGSPGPLQDERRALVGALLDQMAAEQARLSRIDAEKRYMANVEKSRKGSDRNSADPDERYAFRALTGKSGTDVRKNVVGAAKKPALQQDYGLTDAEVSAIRIFTNDDYGYINPATANSPAWLQSNKSSAMTQPAFDRDDATDADRLSEGPVHVGVAITGLRKLPAYSEDVYRGTSASEEDVQKWMDNGLEFTALASASTLRKKAEDFAKNNRTKDKPVEVIFVIHDCGGRDIHEISVYGDEAEVTILPGSKYTVNTRTVLPSDPDRTIYQLDMSV